MWLLSRKQKRLLKLAGLLMTLFLLFLGRDVQGIPISPSATPAPTPITQLDTSKVAGATHSDASSSALVTRVIDGDTIEVSMSGQLKKLRMIGIDTPETVDPRRSVECFGKEASAKTKELLSGKEVILEKDVSETDRYGRLLRYVYLDGAMINELLVAQGYAEASAYPPDVKHQEKLSSAEKTAREQLLGLWANDACLL